MANTLGQYVYRNSFVHRLDPRLKLLCMLALSILIFIVDSTNKIIIFTFFIVAISLLSKLGIKNFVDALKPFYFIFAFILIMYFAFSRSQLLRGLVAIWRFLMLIIMSLILTSTTQISSMIAAIERLLKPLNVLDIRPRNAAVMISIAIRFVPVMLINSERLKDAMLSRLANFRKFRHIRLIVIALLERMLKSASNLSDAMQSRLYNEDAESQKILHFSKYDYASAVFILVFVIIVY